MKKMKFGVLVLCMLLLAGLLSGCGSEYSGMSDSYVYSKNNGVYDSESIFPTMGISSSTVDKDGNITSGVETAPQTESARKLIRKFNLRTETLEFDSFIEYITSQTKAYGGYIEASNIYGSNYYNSIDRSRSASLTLRVPEEYLDVFVESIGNISNITFKNESGEDVTLSYLETESRIASLEIQRDKLLEWMEKATNVDELISLESRLSEVRYELEYYASVLKNYDNLVSYGTILLDVYEVERMTPVVEESVGSQMASGLSETLYDIKEGVIDFSVWFVTNLPYLIIWLIIVVIIVIIVRVLYKKEKKRMAAYNKRLQERTVQNQAQTIQNQTSQNQMPQNQEMQDQKK